MKRLPVFLILILTIAMAFFMVACDSNGGNWGDNWGGCNGDSSGCDSGEYVTTTLQAENAAIVSGTVESEHSGYTGSGYANTDNGTGNYIEFALNATQADTYDLTFFYALASGSRNGSIQVNGSTQVSNIYFNATGAWTTWGTASASVTLIAGDNTIRVTAEQSDGLPNVDKMEVYGFAVTGENTSGDSGGSSGDSGGSSGSGSGITGASCTSTGTVTVTQTIVVSSGTYDGQCKTYVPVGMGTGDQSEDQDPVFRVENGATLKNVIIGKPGVDGIHLYNGATLDNITWTDVGEDACTVKSSGTYYISNIEGYNGSDKFFQINAASTVSVSNAIIHNMGKALRQNGGTYFKINVSFDRCEIQGMDEGIFRSDSSISTARITNSRLHNAGDICIGNWASCTSSGITYY